MKLQFTKTAISTAVALTCLSTAVMASSHREAPQISHMPSLDASDFYAFMDYADENGDGSADNSDQVVLIANYHPLQDAYGGPNYFALHPDAIYEIHVDNNGDGKEDVTFQWDFSQKLASKDGLELDINGTKVDIPLKNASPVDQASPLVNFYETYTVKMIKGDRRHGQKMMLNSGEPFAKPLDYIGDKSFNDYETYAADHIHDIDIASCGTVKSLLVSVKMHSLLILEKLLTLLTTSRYHWMEKHTLVFKILPTMI